MQYKAKKYALTFSPVIKVRRWLKRVKLKNHGYISLYNFLKLFIHNLQKDEIADRANGVAYNFILAIFPAIIFLFTLVPYVSHYFPEITTGTIMHFLSDVMPPTIYGAASDTILDIVRNQRGGLLTAGFVMALYLSTNGMLALMRSFNACYSTVEKRNFFKMRFTALGLTLMMTFALFLTITLLIVGQLVVDYITTDISQFSRFNLDNATIFMLFALRFVVVFVVFFVAISCVFFFAPAIHYNWSFFSIGSLVSTLGGLAVSYGFSYYVTNFGSYNKVYGSIGALIALMVWIQLLTLVLLFGYEINATLHHGHKVEAIQRHRRTKKIEKVYK
jgi:membrane protein